MNQMFLKEELNLMKNLNISLIKVHKNKYSRYHVAYMNQGTI